jgi:hypothetical protein
MGNPVPINVAGTPPWLPMTEGFSETTVILTDTGGIEDTSAYPI